MSSLAIPNVQQPSLSMPRKNIPAETFLRPAQYALSLSSSQNPQVHKTLQTLIEGSDIAAYMSGEKTSPPLKIGDVQHLKDQIQSLFGKDFSTYSIAQIFAKTILISQSYLQYFNLIGTSNTKFQLPYAEWLIPSASLYGKIQECFTLATTLTQESGMDKHLQSMKLLGCLASTFLCAAQLGTYLYLYRLSASTTLSLTTLTYLTSLYETVSREYNQSSPVLQEIQTIPSFQMKV